MSVMRIKIVGFVTAVLLVCAPSMGAAQGIVFDTEQPVSSMLAALREGSETAFGQAQVILRSIETEPEVWPRSRLDSLSEGIADVAAEDRYPYVSSLLRMILSTEGGDGLPVARFEQLTALFEADLEWMSRAGLIRSMEVFAGDPGTVEFLARVAIDEDKTYRQIERIRAVEALTASELGRGRLRAIQQTGGVADDMAQARLRELAAQGFRRGGNRDRS